MVYIKNQLSLCALWSAVSVMEETLSFGHAAEQKIMYCVSCNSPAKVEQVTNKAKDRLYFN